MIQEPYVHDRGHRSCNGKGIEEVDGGEEGAEIGPVRC